MKIHTFTLKRHRENIRASAAVQFEESDLGEKEVFIETASVYEAGFSADPAAFLVGCLVPAIHLGERRIRIEEPVCPFLLEGLHTAMHILKEWTGGKYAPIAIEAPAAASVEPVTPPRTGMVVSGGMDSLATLRLNRLHYPDTHPAYVKDCLFLHGFDIGGVVRRGMKYPVFERAQNALLKITQETHANLIPVYTNIRHLCDERELWLDSFFGAVLAAAAHTFSKRLSLLFIASSYDIPHLHPCGSHPLLDPEYSSYSMRIRHRDYALSRLEKIAIVSKWDTAFQNFRVCLANVPDRLNCGKCEKCVRTMTELLALGLLDKTGAFVENDVAPEQISRYDITIRVRPPFYRAMLPLLKAKERHDLADVIEEQIGKSITTTR